MDYDKFVAVGLLEKMDARLLTPSFERLWPVEENPEFNGLLEAIDEADQRLKDRTPPH